MAGTLGSAGEAWKEYTSKSVPAGVKDFEDLPFIFQLFIKFGMDNFRTAPV
jgi:hypothetical protein